MMTACSGHVADMVVSFVTWFTIVLIIWTVSDVCVGGMDQILHLFQLVNKICECSGSTVINKFNNLYVWHPIVTYKLERGERWPVCHNYTFSESYCILCDMCQLTIRAVIRHYKNTCKKSTCIQHNTISSDSSLDHTACCVFEIPKMD